MNGEGRLHQRFAIVTGAGEGIGEATARLLAQEGATVLAVDAADTGIAAMFKRMPNVHSAAIDVADAGAPEALAELADTHLDGLDIFVWVGPEAPAPTTGGADDARWDRTFAVSLRPSYRLTHALLPRLRKSPGGRVINVGSVYSSRGAAGLSAYTAAQHGLMGLTRALAAEVGRDGITVNCILPGAIMTEATREAFRRDTGMRDYWIRKAAVGRLGEALDVAKAALFLASDDAAFITGTGLHVDGGAIQSA
ncbi:MAG: SDR family NAD(P)-dependent oxidoreductase [Pseudomonadota bacterium]